jgi:AraC family transcriptional regulator
MLCRSSRVGWGGKTPLYCERYLLSGVDRSLSALPVLAMSVQLGGSRVMEGRAGQWRSKKSAKFHAADPPGCATNWNYSGTVDVGGLYFVGPREGLVARFLALFGESRSPLQFSDSLVGSAAQQIFAELQKGAAADDEYIEKLADVLLEQSYRVLTTPGVTGLAPSHVHYPRLQKVLHYIRANLAEDLSVASLADLPGSAKRISAACSARRWVLQCTSSCKRRGWSRRASCSPPAACRSPRSPRSAGSAARAT